jgi:CoA:oxalate CoA-transferase
MSIGDIGAGLYTAVAVNAALFARASSGKGSKVDISMFDCQLALLENAAMRYFVSGKAPGPLGARHPSITPFEAFDTQTNPIIIAAGNDSLFVKLASALGRPEMAKDPRYLTNDLRNQNVDALKTEIESVLKTKPVGHWMDLLDAAGIPAGPINNIAQAIDHRQAKARNMVIELEDAVAGKMKFIGNPMKISGFPDPSTRAPAPDLDGNRAQILAELK